MDRRKPRRPETARRSETQINGNGGDELAGDEQEKGKKPKRHRGSPLGRDKETEFLRAYLETPQGTKPKNFAHSWKAEDGTKVSEDAAYKLAFSASQVNGRSNLDPGEREELGKRLAHIRRPEFSDAQKIKIVREFLNTEPPLSFEKFVKKREGERAGEKGESVSYVTLARWAKEAREGNLKGLTDLERATLEQRANDNRRGEESAPEQAKDETRRSKRRAPLMGQEKETEFLRGYLRQPRGTRLGEYVRNGSHGIDVNERRAYGLARSAQFPGGRSALADEERKELAERLKENLQSRDYMRRPVTMTDAPHVRSGPLGSPTMASAAAARPAPTPLIPSGSYDPTFPPPEAAPTSLPDFDSLASVADGGRLPPVFSFEQAAYSGAYGTGTTPPPASFNAQGHPGYGGGGQGPARGGR
ncbi:hypothetical protein ACFC09_05730 [Streptomyces sp. NPDC056161]|uniref:hypothetical protein n=1 Tax=Streptomyces sp. NPDC056161 TaxID=3345732 RepID=UPI0035DB2E20